MRRWTLFALSALLALLLPGLAWAPAGSALAGPGTSVPYAAPPGPQALLQEISEGSLLRRRALGEAGIQVGNRARPQFLAQFGDPLILQVAHRSPRAKMS
jgi:hypothetical protein